MTEFPKWLAVDGPGHPGNPGKVLVENEEQEAEALRTGTGPDYLNPVLDEGRANIIASAPVAEILADGQDSKPIAEQNRAEMVATMATLMMRSPLSDDDIRKEVQNLQDWLSARDAERAEDEERDDDDANHQSADDDIAAAAEPIDPSESGGPGRDEHEGDVEPATDAAGEKVPPPADQEANKDQLADGERTLPIAKADQATDARPDDAKEREAGTTTATDQIEQALTPPDEKSPPEEGGAKKKATTTKK